MRVGKPIFIIALLVLAANLVGGSHDQTPSGTGLGLHPAIGVSHIAVLQRQAIPLLMESRTSEPGKKHGEKRHGKSLISEAIVADCPFHLVRPFTYCQRNYSRFLPIVCISQYTGNLSLRGPPLFS